MDYHVIEINNQKYIECYAAQPPIQTEQDALDLVAACGENDTNLLMIHTQALSDTFFQLKTGIAGAILQKFINYRVKTAIVIQEGMQVTGRLKELLTEANKGNDYRTFRSRDEAQNWLLRTI